MQVIAVRPTLRFVLSIRMSDRDYIARHAKRALWPASIPKDALFQILSLANTKQG
jgi:hypothetical protein